MSTIILLLHYQKRGLSPSEVKKFLNDHPEYIREGANISQFSFQLPRPLADNYVKKRTRQVKPTAATENKLVALLSPCEHRHQSKVNPLKGQEHEIEETNKDEFNNLLAVIVHVDIIFIFMTISTYFVDQSKTLSIFGKI
ncbi:PREDICTED: uncharacterized protein LOC104728198 [Camelina sativa]|uniref:Uncharacterized protein LOC104728198 n=1 Tax=Camelina sativa TaxID=90675 RepID=A0ABM0USG4_CAMSA|nr:PREDICTED: uncharacterized protein LOC104728198 [Camelina sativa]